MNKHATNAISNIAQKEHTEVVKKELNLLVSGIKEPAADSPNKQGDDKTKVKNMLVEIGLDSELAEDCKITRFKSRDAKPGNLLLVCNSSVTKRTILSKANKLKDSTNFKNTYINNDLTLAQQQNEKELRTERNARNAALSHTGENNLKYGYHKFNGSEVA